MIIAKLQHGLVLVAISNNACLVHVNVTGTSKRCAFCNFGNLISRKKHTLQLRNRPQQITRLRPTPADANVSFSIITSD